LGLLLGLCLAPSVHANQARLDHLRPIAEQHFPAAQERCHNGIAIVTGGLRRPAPVRAEAWDASFTGQPGYCEVRLAENWPDWRRSVLCDVLVHEFGHLAGLAHSSDPNDVMYSGSDANVVPGCTRLYEIGLQLEARQGKLDWARTMIAYYREQGLQERAKRCRVRITLLREQIVKLEIELGP
jgi:hypothetical protein